jgi:hypothetical protein
MGEVDNHQPIAVLLSELLMSGQRLLPQWGRLTNKCIIKNGDWWGHATIPSSNNLSEMFCTKICNNIKEI